ncbi:MAG: biotin transporter BioY, partial [Halobacteriota archaeon]
MELYDVDRLRKMAYAAVFAALTGAGALLSIPIGPVPLTLQTFFIMLAGYVLGARWGGVSIALYLLLGAAGLPVFSGGSAGAGHLLGPTAGFLWAFPVAAFAVGAFAEASDGRPGAQRLAFKIGGALAGSVVIYALGTAQLMNFFGMGVSEALAVGVLPFLPTAAVEVAGAIGASESLNRAGIA